MTESAQLDPAQAPLIEGGEGEADEEHTTEGPDEDR